MSLPCSVRAGFRGVRRMRRGFTLMELILVIVVLAIIAIAALPKFSEIVTNALHSSRDGVVGAVRSGIMVWTAEDMDLRDSASIFPDSLDSNGVGACAGCFSKVLGEGVSDSHWRKTADNTYSFNDGVAVFLYNYNSTTGAFGD